MRATGTRRQALAAMAGVSGISAQTGKPGTRIHQEVEFRATPSRIYEILLDARQFAKFTALAAEIQPQPGGAIKLFDGHIEGRNIELAPNQRIVQAWREVSWKPGYFSLVRFELVARNSGTHLVFDQTGIAEDDWGHLNEGWPIRYWEPLRKYLST